MKRIGCLIVMLALLAGTPGWARVASPSGGISAEQIQLRTEKTVLDNGLTVLVTPMPESPVVAVYALVKAGSATEGEFLGAGITHFMEHMLFKGTARRGVGEIAQSVLAVGGTINASTGFDYTIYTINVPRAGVPTAIDVLADMLQNARFDAEELEREREVVYREMNMRNDSPDSYLNDLVAQTAYTRHPYRLPIIGFEDVLARLTRDDFLRYYRERYNPNNIIFTVAGGVTPQEVLPQIEQAFAGDRRGIAVLRNLPVEPRQIAPRRYEESYPTDLTRLSMNYAGVAAVDADMPALDLLAMILGQGESSRLYRTVFKEQQLVDSIAVSNYTPMDRGLFGVDCALDDARVEPAMAAIQQQIDQIIARGVTDREVDKARRQVLSQYVWGLQSASALAYATAINEAVTGDYDFSKKYVALVNQVTAADIRRVAGQYLRPEHLTTVILHPRGSGGEEGAAPAEAGAGAISKEVLANGVTVLLRENPALPVVTMTVALNGGSRYEPAELTGLSDLTARMWTQGTRTRSAEEIARQVEEMGGGLSGFSGRNSLGLQMSLLSDDLPAGLEILLDVLRNPVFPDAELATEKDKMLTAIKARDDRISSAGLRILRGMLFEKNPLRREALGTPETVGRITRADVRGFYDRLFVPANLVVTVFGNFDADEVRAVLRKGLGALPPRDLEQVAFAAEPLAEQRAKVVRADKEQAFVAVGFQGVDLYDPDRYGLDVLASILGSSFNGRMFKTIREQMGAAYTLGGGFSPARDGGIIAFQASTTDENAEVVRDKIFALIEDIRENGVSDEELQAMKTYMKGTFEMGLETDGAVAFMSGLDELYGLGYAYYQGVPAAIDAVTPADVQRLARQYLNPEQAAVVMVRPRDGAEPPGAAPGEMNAVP